MWKNALIGMVFIAGVVLVICVVVGAALVVYAKLTG